MDAGASGGLGKATQAVELPARLVFSLLQAAVRLAARVHMPLDRITDLLRTAYFLEHRRKHPRDLQVIADKLGVSLRTAGSLNKQLKEPFFAPETEVEPIRIITGALLGAPSSIEGLAAITQLDIVEVRRAIKHLQELGWVDVDEHEVARLAGTLRSFVTEDLQRRVDGVNHQLAIIADSVWARFARGEDDTAGARSWSFAARPEDVEAAMERTFKALRAEAVEMEEAALEQGGGARYGITVAFAPREEER